MTAIDYLDGDEPGGELIAEIATLATYVGTNRHMWPGLTVYRLTQPKPPWAEVAHGLSLGILAQGRKTITVDGRRYSWDPLSYVLFAAHLRYQSEIVEATPTEPCLCLLLEIPPTTVRSTATKILRHPSTTPHSPHPDRLISALDDELTGAVLRFLRSLSSPTDRRVLTPLYEQELAYRFLRREEFARIAEYAKDDAIAAVLTYIATHLSEPLTVSGLAARASLSPSAFSRNFRDLTGCSPYQYIKHARLGRAGELLIDGEHSVANVAHAVGYSGASHFIREFRIRFGITPTGYVSSDARGAVEPIVTWARFRGPSPD